MKNKNKVIIGLVALIILVIAFFGGRNALDIVTETNNVNSETILQTGEIEDTEKTIPKEESIVVEEEKEQITLQMPTENKEEELSEPVCYISIKCDSVLKNLDKLTKGKEQIIPTDGVMLKQQKIIFSEGESVFDILLKTTKENEIHLEFVNTPMFNSAYIEGIGNLYEFDCGDYSGWTYSVNGVFPTCGSSQYKVKNGDFIEFVYVCNMLKK